MSGSPSPLGESLVAYEEGRIGLGFWGPKTSLEFLKVSWLAPHYLEGKLGKVFSNQGYVSGSWVVPGGVETEG